MIEYPLFPRDVCPDQWWPDVDDSYPDECTDQRYPPDMPDVRGWDRLSANPGQDIINVVRQLAAQAGLYMIYSPHQKGKSDHVADLSGRGWHVAAYTSDEHVYHSPYVLFDSDLDSADPTVETPQTRADILAWKKKQGKGPAKNWFNKRGR